MAFPLAALTAIPQIATGLYSTIQGAKGLKNLAGQPQPQYSMSPEYTDYYNRINAQSQYGYSPEQTAQFGQGVAQQQNTGFRQGVSMSGGNLAQALRTGLAGQNLGAFNQFAAQGAALQQQKLGQVGAAAGQMQEQQNLINQQKIQRRMALEQAYGGALQSGLSNMASGLTSGLGLGFMQGGGGKAGISDLKYNNMVDQDILSGYFNK